MPPLITRRSPAAGAGLDAGCGQLTHVAFNLTHRRPGSAPKRRIALAKLGKRVRRGAAVPLPHARRG